MRKAERPGAVRELVRELGATPAEQLRAMARELEQQDMPERAAVLRSIARSVAIRTSRVDRGTPAERWAPWRPVGAIDRDDLARWARAVLNAMDRVSNDAEGRKALHEVWHLLGAISREM